MSTTAQVIRSLQESVWNGSLPLNISLSPADSRVYDKTDPYYIHFPRLSYLPFLLPKLHAFFQDVLIDPSVAPSSAWFSFEGVPLKWHHPVGLLYDLFSGSVPAMQTTSFASSSNSKQVTGSSSLPWRIILHYSSFPIDQLVQLDSEGKAVHDAFINSVKEADFLRNGNANAIMKLNIEDSTSLWKSVVDHQLSVFAPIYNRLVPAQSSLRHIPLRIYLPSAESPAAPFPGSPPSSPRPASAALVGGSPKPDRSSSVRSTSATSAGHLRVVQSLITPFLSGNSSSHHHREPQTLGTALNGMIPALFPSRRRVVLARPVLHGAVVPLEAVLEDLMRGACYADGWVNLGVEMII